MSDRPTLAAVHTLYDSNTRSIPCMLRQAADSIEGEVDDPECSKTTAIVTVQITEDGQVQIYGWGETDDMHALAMLERGKHELMKIICDE